MLLNSTADEKRHLLWFVPIIFFLVLIVGCCPSYYKSHSTLLLKSTTTEAPANPPKVIKKIDDLHQPFAVIAQIYVFSYAGCLGKRYSKKEAFDKLSIIAQQIGADAIVEPWYNTTRSRDLEDPEGPSCIGTTGISSRASALAVKIGESGTRPPWPFVAAIMPIKVHGEKELDIKMDLLYRDTARIFLERKGYFCVIPDATNISGQGFSIDEIREMDPDRRMSLGGDMASVLAVIQLGCGDRHTKGVPFAAVTELECTIVAFLIDKKTGNLIWSDSSSGKGNQPFFLFGLSLIFTDDLKAALTSGFSHTFESLPSIHGPVSEKRE